MIGILDAELGNIRSVANAVHSLGYDYTVIKVPEHLDAVTHLILPGVGSYHTAMSYLQRLDFIRGIKAVAASGRPVLGLCLGMQLLSDRGDEGGDTEGLGLVRGRVERLAGGETLPLPHVGWNSLKVVKSHPVFFKVKSGVDFYFVHSYHFACSEEDCIVACTEYGQEFHAAVGRNNVLGLQFHPEKSQGNGLKLLGNFCDWDGKM